jgi:hypothetical protein
MTAEPIAWTESAITCALRDRFTTRTPNGTTEAPRYLFAPQVRLSAGFDARRIIDAIAVDTWPSSGLPIHAFEIKTSRGDWLRELANPDKARDALTVCSTMSVVAPAGVVQDGELPDGWGLYRVAGDPGKVRRVRPPQVIGALPGAPIGRSFAIALMRAAIADGTRMIP